MQKVRSFVALFVFALLLAVAQVFAQAGTIVEVASGNENLSTLVSLVDSAGLVETLNGEGPFVVFAPNNDAFAALPESVVSYVVGNPELLASVLTYHVLALSADELDDGEFATVQGENIELSSGSDGNGYVNGVQVVDVVEASNGMIFVLDQVLIPSVELPAVDPLDVTGDAVTAGSSTVYPLSERMLESFSNAGYAGQITIDSIGTGAGFERFCVAGETDVANASRAIKDSEVESCAAINRTPLEFRVGTDALAVIVSSANDFVTDVTTEELAMIFSTAVNWSDVRAEWPNEPIQRFSPGTDSGTFDYFVEIVFDKDEAPILAASNLQLSEDDNVLVQGVEGSPYAIGFFGYAYYQANASALKTVAVDGIAPSFDTANDGSYSLSRPLFLYSDASILTEKPQVAAFLNYYLTNVNAEISDVGYFPAHDNDLNLARLTLLAALGQ